MRSPSTSPILDVFRDLRLTGSRYLTSTLDAPWGLRIPPCERAIFHFVANGRCVIRMGDVTDTLEQGDFVLLPRGPEHDLLDAVDSTVQTVSSLPSEEISELGWSLSHGGDGERSVLLSGSFVFEAHPVVAELPPVLYVRRTSQFATQTARVVASLLDELAVTRPGSATVVNRLADVLVIEVIRCWLDTVSHADRGWFAALHHEGLGRALALIHTDAMRAWTLKELAAEAGMSRASFARKFSELVGTPPIHFLSSRRMHLATHWLRDDALTISEVSERLGYSSEAAFSRAFKRITGRTPGAAARGHTN